MNNSHKQASKNDEDGFAARLRAHTERTRGSVSKQRDGIFFDLQKNDLLPETHQDNVMREKRHDALLGAMQVRYHDSAPLQYFEPVLSSESAQKQNHIPTGGTYEPHVATGNDPHLFVRHNTVDRDGGYSEGIVNEYSHGGALVSETWVPHDNIAPLTFHATTPTPLRHISEKKTRGGVVSTNTRSVWWRVIGVVSALILIASIVAFVLERAVRVERDNDTIRTSTEYSLVR